MVSDLTAQRDTILREAGGKILEMTKLRGTSFRAAALDPEVTMTTSRRD
jgi:hypothetical protein